MRIHILLLSLLVPLFVGCMTSKVLLIEPPAPPPCNQTTLFRCVPSTFGDSVQISFCLADSGFTRVEIFNVEGNHPLATIVDSMLCGDYYSFVWGGEKRPGIYFVRMLWRGHTFTKKFILRR